MALDHDESTHRRLAREGLSSLDRSPRTRYRRRPRFRSRRVKTLTNQYEQLINEASAVFPGPADRLDEALLMLIETSDRSRRSAIAKYRYWFRPDSAREPLRRAREARREHLDWGYVDEAEDATEQHLMLQLAGVTPPEYAFAWQARTLDIVPLEASPLTKTSIGKVAAEGGTLAICFFTGGPALCIVGSMGLIAVRDSVKQSRVSLLGRG